MSTVLWANLLVHGKVVSDQADRYALYRHGDKLDGICRSLGLPPFLDGCDATDARYNLEEIELPPGMTSTDEVMAVQGVWLPLNQAISMLEALLRHITTGNVRFGLLKNQHADVVAELSEVLAFAKSVPEAEKFNFSIVT